jgi:uncharacterized protein YifE (UPF0438 family)
MGSNDLEIYVGLGAKQADSQLTDWDRELLRRYLEFYQSLDTGKRAPVTHQQQRFVAVCRGIEQARTQHEIAYMRFRSAGPQANLTRFDAKEGSVQDFQKRLEAIDRIESLVALMPSRSDLTSFVGGIRERLRSGAGWAKEKITSSAALATAIVNDPELARSMEQWSAETFNTLSNAYTKAMDGSFVEGLRAGADYVAPTVHRLFGGHTPGEAWEAVRGALPNDGFAQELVGYLSAMGSDFASVTGLPLTTLESQESLTKFVEYFQSLGLSESWVVDVLHQNAIEFIGAAVPAVGAALCFNSADQEQFGRIVGSLGIVALVSANPLGALAAVVMLGLALRKTIGTEDAVGLASAVGTGAVTGGTVVAISSVIGGPVVVGIMVTVLASMVVRKLGAGLDREKVLSTLTVVTRRVWTVWTAQVPRPASSSS